MDVNENKGQRWYACFVVGKGFSGSLIGRATQVGFYTTRFVRAPTAEAAKSKAILDLTADRRLQLDDGAESPKSTVLVEECVEVSESDVPSDEEGFVWFEEG